MARVVIFLFLAVVIGIALAEAYRIVPGPEATLLKILIFHSVLAVGILFTWRKHCFSLPSSIKSYAQRIEWFPSLFLILAIGCAFTISLMIGDPEVGSYGYNVFWVVVWAPIVEELVFRKGFGSFFRRNLSPWQGGYISASLFAFVHSQPTLSRLLAGEAGIPLGPFLLGLVCETIFAMRGRILPCMVFHGLCNLSGYLFAAHDARWLKWLDILYI